MGDSHLRSKLSHFLVIGIMVLAFLGGLEYYLHIVRGVYQAYPHAAYIPIVIAAFWWRLKGGLLIGSFLGLMHVLFHLPDEIEIALPRALMFILVGFVTGKMCARRRQSEDMLRKTHDELEDKMLELEDVNKRLVQSGEQIRSAYEKLKQLQSQLIQSERLAVLGELSAGIAHEINNPLNIISVHTQILSMEENLDPEVKETLEIIKKQVDQASKITDKLLQFAKSTKPEMAVVDVNELIGNVLALLEHQLTLDNIKIARQLIPKLPSISADPGQLQQVFLNLITNASHSMPNGGTLTISTEVKTPNIEIRFTDTGTGIPKENLGKLFEPFFTTREKGAGLGLSVVHGIIEAHNGNIKVESEVGKGATFTITLPIKKQS